MREKQKKAIESFLRQGNMQEAMKEAGYSVCTYQAAQRLFSRPEVRAYLNESLEKMDEKKIADAEEIMEYLTLVMRGKITEQVLVIEKDEEGRKVASLVNKEVSASARLRAADILSKRFGITNEGRGEAEGEGPIVINEDLT